MRPSRPGLPNRSPFEEVGVSTLNIVVLGRVIQMLQSA
jgi:hypothetical protein